MSDTPIPPLPVNDGGIPSQDFESTADNFTQKNADDQLAWLQANAKPVGQTLGAVHDASQADEKRAGFIASVLADILLFLDKIDFVFQTSWLNFEQDLMESMLRPMQSLDSNIHTHLLTLLAEAFQGSPRTGLNFGTGIQAFTIQSLFQQMVQPFTLMTTTADISQPGAGIANQQYLLALGLNLAVQEKVIEDLGNHLGMGVLKTLAPYTNIIENSVNPKNVVRKAMDSSYAMLLQAPLTRDLNRAYPVKQLGVSALAHAYIREDITGATYLDKCLDAGLDPITANMLLHESAKLLAEADIAKLLNLGYIQKFDAVKLYAQLGYLPDSIDAKLYIDAHQRYFTLQERVGSEAVTAAKHGYITKERLEEILQQTGYTPDEIALLEIELEFVASTSVDALGNPTRDHITYTQIRDLFKNNLISIDDVISYLKAHDYTEQEVIDLVLLDFTAAAERAAQLNVLQARLRVLSQENHVASLAAAKKNETDLAAAKAQLASELKAEADTLGQLTTGAGILASLGVLP